MTLLVILTLILATVEGQMAQEDHKDTHCAQGRSVIVQLFDWRWDDIGLECEVFLGPYGYCGVQISPPNEHRIINEPFRPWWERSQPVSYKLVSRSGDETQFTRMVERCNAFNVRIYADVIFNHMTPKGTGSGTAGSLWDGTLLSYNAVPYGPRDFNSKQCPSPDGQIHNWDNPTEVRNCRLLGLSDLDLGSDDVRSKVAGYLNRLVDKGVAGFRVSFAEYMWPNDIQAILERVKDLRSNIFGPNKASFFYQQVVDSGKASEYLESGMVENFKFGAELEKVFDGRTALKWLSNFGVEWDMPQGNDVVTFVDDAVMQRKPGALTHKDARNYKLANAFMLAHSYGNPRVMSSYSFENADAGPPHVEDDIEHVVSNADLTCGNGWICEHRWRQIYNMVALRNIAGSEPFVNFRAFSNNTVSFNRGRKAFIIINLVPNDFTTYMQVGLPRGKYCDVITGNLVDGNCTGKMVEVTYFERAHINVCGNCADPILALHVGAKIGETPRRMGE